MKLSGVKLGNYRLRTVLGRGNMGVVYLATDEALLRPTAVKVMTWSPSEHDPEAWFLAEARSVAKLNHPSVVQIYSVARHGPYCYIAMEYVEGVSAEAMVIRNGPMSAERATEVIMQLATALELAHTSGIIHRDVKPGNILINSDGTAKLGDFGMAVSQTREPKSKLRAGTPHYFAPEIWRGEPASVATDVYALGATYYYLLTGRPPLDGSTIATLSVAHQRQEFVAPPELSAACVRVVRRCLAKHAHERYESARAVAWEARGVLRELESPWLVTGSEPSARVRPETTPPAALGDAGPEWLGRGFLFEPFAEIDPHAPPYSGAPFDEMQEELLGRLGVSGTTLVLAGAPGSGRSTLARSLLVGAARTGAYIDVAHAGLRPGSITQRIARAFGAIASSTAGGAAELEGMLELLAAGPRGDDPPLIVVDGVSPGTRAAVEISVLARAARSTRYFSLLVIGAADLAEELSGGDAASALVEMPPLTAPQVASYVEAWLRATRAPDAPPLILTVDAALLVGHRAEGNLHRINTLARHMIATGGQILTSWDAWTAADDPGAAPRGPGAPVRRPTTWPTAQVLRLINQYRVAAGLGERGAVP
jgi:hypothetical protein